VSVIDYWLNIHRRAGEATTTATPATKSQDALVSAAFDVAIPLLHGCYKSAGAENVATCSKGVATFKPAETQASPSFVAGVAVVAGEPKRETSARVERGWGGAAGIPRDWAEGLARLHPDRPIGDVPARRWLRFVDDVGRFLDGPFCATAAALGWTPLDLFGCDHDRPFARIDQAGLLWLLSNSRIVAMTESAATIERPTGSRQTYRRRPSGPEQQALPWELAIKAETPP
jgi:hypothetical protein